MRHTVSGLAIAALVFIATRSPVDALNVADTVVPESAESKVDFTAFSKLAPTSFLQAVIKSGGTKADCRTFATTTISTISVSVKSQGEILNAVDDGAGCAFEGQELVQVAQEKLQGKQGVLATKEGSAKTAREAKTVACTAAVDMSVGLDTLTKASCYDYTTEASFVSTDAACNQAKTAVTQADGAVVSAQASVEDAQGEVDDAVAEAARLESGCLCRVHQEQATAQVAVQAATATNAADWKQAHEVLCAVKQTTTCPVPSCPTVTQPTLADGVANADTQHCTQAKKTGFTPPPVGFKWVKGANGATCDQTCANIQMTADASELNKLTTNELVGEAFRKAGYTCRSFHGKRNYAGTPFSKNTPNDDCAPVIPGSSVVTNRNGHGHHSPLCYCSQGGF